MNGMLNYTSTTSVDKYQYVHMGDFCLLNAWAAEERPYFSSSGKTALHYTTITLNLLKTLNHNNMLCQTRRQLVFDFTILIV